MRLLLQSWSVVESVVHNDERDNWHFQAAAQTENIRINMDVAMVLLPFIKIGVSGSSLTQGYPLCQAKNKKAKTALCITENLCKLPETVLTAVLGCAMLSAIE